MTVEVCRFERCQAEAWDEYVERAGDAAQCHLNGWRHVIERAYGHQAVYLWARDGGKVKGVLPLILFRNIRFGKALVSMPYLDDGGICADDYATAVELYTHAQAMCMRHDADSLDLRHRQPSGLSLPRHGSKVTLILPLEADPDRVWQGLDAKVRNQIRKATKSGLTVSWCGI
jgi:hypothetical protein